MARPFRINLKRTPHQNSGPPRWNSWLCFPRFLVMKTMTRTLVVAINTRKMLARMVRFSLLKDRSQIKIQARLRMKLMESVMVTEGVRIWGLR